MKVDKSVQLVDILPAGAGAPQVRRVCALKKGNSVPVKAALLNLAKKHPEDYAKLMRIVRLVAASDENFTGHVKRGKGKDYRDIYEMRGGKARLFFFVRQETVEIVVCTHLYWKTKPSAREQTEEFAKAKRVRDFYESLVE